MLVCFNGGRSTVLIRSRLLRCHSTKSVISIRDATFYKRYPTSKDGHGHNPALFEKLNFTLLDRSNTNANQVQFWAVVSQNSVSRTAFLQILNGSFVSLPPNARQCPLLSQLNTSPHHAIKYVGFDAERGTNVGGDSVRGAYLSARYESRREKTDYSVQDYLTGRTALNAVERDRSDADASLLEEVVTKLDLHKLRHMPVSNLSNGQTRRARIAKALLDQPEVLLLDGAFMGLDPNTVVRLSGILQRIADRGKPRLVLSLRPEDLIPSCVNQLLVIDEHNRIVADGDKQEILAGDAPQLRSILDHPKIDDAFDKVSRDGWSKNSPGPEAGEAVVEMLGAVVSYSGRTVLGDWQQEGKPTSGLYWTLRRGDRCGIFGANGSGKTTMLSLITSDHPQTYSLPIKLFGRNRLPKPGEVGITLFDLQRRMGHSSPEVHAFFPRRSTVRRALESAWADAPLAKPVLNDEANTRVDNVLRWFADELRPKNSSKDGLDWAKKLPFAELSFSNQRLVLFLRSIVADPDLVILDEAFSGMDEDVRDKALLFLSHGETIIKVENGRAIEPEHISDYAFRGLKSEQALLVISHAREDVPGCIRQWICLQEPGDQAVPRVGILPGPLELNPEGWAQIWGRA